MVAKRLNAEYWPVSSLTGYQVQEFFKRVACVSYQMLINQQLNPEKSSVEIKSTKTQLAVNLNSLNRKKKTSSPKSLYSLFFVSLGHTSQQKSNDNCC